MQWITAVGVNDIKGKRTAELSQKGRNHLLF